MMAISVGGAGDAGTDEALRGNDAAMTTALVPAAFGGGLEHREVPRAEPGMGEVLVEVAASGVNPLDLKIRDGGAAHARVNVLAVLGIDLAGTVVAVGAGAGGFAVGDEVYGMAGGVGGLPGTLARQVVVDIDLLARKPARLTMVQAAALPLALVTAWEGLVDRAEVGPGQTVLVHGGAGGVGHIAVQLAVARGARVFAMGTGASLEVIRGLGAEPIDYRATSVTDYVASATGGAGSTSCSTRSAGPRWTHRSRRSGGTPGGS
ncbi:alcohol dehydrogenase catalytic domain-containing protein [Frankia sp. R82]|nr:alcohol dehydrogenase catalytic domain-containing protein [Frankia sp. R82]MCM3882663.1 alcohol dehydrogenase catalytic domain-containing protein [Frankia sp. R82]